MEIYSGRPHPAKVTPGPAAEVRRSGAGGSGHIAGRTEGRRGPSGRARRREPEATRRARRCPSRPSVPAGAVLLEAQVDPPGLHPGLDPDDEAAVVVGEMDLRPALAREEAVGPDHGPDDHRLEGPRRHPDRLAAQHLEHHGVVVGLEHPLEPPDLAHLETERAHEVEERHLVHGVVRHPPAAALHPMPASVLRPVPAGVAALLVVEPVATVPPVVPLPEALLEPERAERVGDEPARLAVVHAVDQGDPGLHLPDDAVRPPARHPLAPLDGQPGRPHGLQGRGAQRHRDAVPGLLAGAEGQLLRAGRRREDGGRGPDTGRARAGRRRKRRREGGGREGAGRGPAPDPGHEAPLSAFTSGAFRWRRSSRPALNTSQSWEKRRNRLSRYRRR